MEKRSVNVIGLMINKRWIKNPWKNKHFMFVCFLLTRKHVVEIHCCQNPSLLEVQMDFTGWNRQDKALFRKEVFIELV